MDRFNFSQIQNGAQIHFIGIGGISMSGLARLMLTRGYRVTGSGTHSGTATTQPPKTSSTRKYLCPCCGNSVRATKAVNIACLDCAEQMVLAG